MSISEKVTNLKRLFKDHGIMAVIRATKKYFVNNHQVDEVGIAFRILTVRKSKGIMLDVGAHHGFALSAFAEKGWEVFAFEPDSENRKKLLERVGEMPNVKVDARAVSNKDGEKMTLFKSEISSGITSLASFHESHLPSEEVELVTLATVLEQYKLSGSVIDFLKIDTEGYDLPVLQGMPWEKQRPTFIVCEFEDNKTKKLGYTFHDLAGFLQSKGYKVIVSEWYPIEEYGKQHKWSRFLP